MRVVGPQKIERLFCFSMGGATPVTRPEIRQKGCIDCVKFKTPTPTQTPGARFATLESAPGGCVILVIVSMMLVIGCVIFCFPAIGFVIHATSWR